MSDFGCTICLEQLKSPVALPCGHLNCEECIASWVHKSEDAVRSQCPTCRQPFTTVTLNPALIPDKYHDFMYPSIRRVYFGESGPGIQQTQELQMRVATLEARIRDLKHDKLMLMSRAESSLAAARAHAEGEAKANRERDQVRDELEDWRKKYHALKKKCHKMKLERAGQALGPEDISTGPLAQVRSLKRKDTDRDDTLNEPSLPLSISSEGHSRVRSPRESEISASSRHPASHQDDRPRRSKQPRLSTEDMHSFWNEPSPDQPELGQSVEDTSVNTTTRRRVPIPVSIPVSFPVQEPIPAHDHLRRRIQPSGLSFATSVMAIDAPSQQSQPASSSSRRSSAASNPIRRIPMTRSRALLMSIDPDAQPRD